MPIPAPLFTVIRNEDGSYTVFANDLRNWMVGAVEVTRSSGEKIDALHVHSQGLAGANMIPPNLEVAQTEAGKAIITNFAPLDPAAEKTAYYSFPSQGGGADGGFNELIATMNGPTKILHGASDITAWVSESRNVLDFAKSLAAGL